MSRSLWRCRNRACPVPHGAVLEGDDGPHRQGRCSGCGRTVPATVTVRIEGVKVALL